MSQQEKEDAELGRAARWFGRWAGGSLLICMVLTCFLGENSPYRDYILVASLLGGAGLAFWLGRAAKKREVALQDRKDVVE